VALFDHNGQLQLPIQSSSAGLLIGADANLYRSAADTLKTDDNLIVGAPGTVAGSVVTIDGTQIQTNKRIMPRIGTAASSATPTINTDNVDQFNITALAVAITSMTSGLSGTPTDGQRLRIRFKDDGTDRPITWGASFVGNLLATTVATKTHVQELMYDVAAAKWVGTYVDTAGY
jgi:hypothetical protein